MRFLSTVAAGLALYIPSTVAEGPMGKVYAWSEPWFRGQQAVYDAPAQCVNFQVPRPRSLQVPQGTRCTLYYKTGCQNDGLWGVQRVAISDMSLAQEPVSFVCSND